MHTLRQALAMFCLPVLVGFFGMAMALSGCDDNNPVANLNTNALSPAQALTYGRQSAIYQDLSHHWQLESVNHLPISYTMSLDLTKLNTGKATALTICSPIEIVFDTSRIDQNKLSVKDIQRNLDNCSDDYEDTLMMILADTKSIARHPSQQNKLVLTAQQDTLIFVLANNP